MSAASKELPRWLQMCKNEILGSHEWNTVKEDLLERLKHEVEKSGIDHLSSLSEEEKIVLLLKVQPAVMQARSYKLLLGVTSKMVGSHLLDDVNRSGGQSLSEPAPNVAPKASQIVDRAAAGAAYLLEKWPQTKAACGNLVNSEHMPHQLRRELWRAWLSRPLVASHYDANPPSHSLSMQHQLVSQTSAAVLRGVEPDLNDDGADLGPTPGVATALAEHRHRYSAAAQEEQLDLIRRLVSYHIRCEEQRLPEVQHSWQDIEAMCCSAVLLVVVIADGTDGGSSSGQARAGLEMEVDASKMAGYFVGFIHQLQEVGLLTGCRKPGHAAATLHRPPDYDNNEAEAQEWTDISRAIEKLLRREDEELYEAILKGQAAYSAASAVQNLSGIGASGDLQAAATQPETAGSSADHWGEFAWTVIRPRMRRLWAGSVTTDAQLLIVDTCLLAGTPTAMARIAVVDLLCRKELFIGSQHSRRAMHDALKGGAALDRPAIRHAIDKHGFAQEMRKVAGVPELPSQAIERQHSRAPPPSVAPVPESPVAVRPLTPPAPALPSPAPVQAIADEPPPEQLEHALAEPNGAASKIQSRWRGKAVRNLRIIQRATDTTSIMKTLISSASSSMRQLSGTPEPP